MAVFRTIYERLLRTGVVSASQVVVPPDSVGRDTLALAHCATYVDAFCDGALAPDAMRRIGFPWTPQLVERTLAEACAPCRLRSWLCAACGRSAAHVSD
jgi:hypothetical protein